MEKATWAPLAIHSFLEAKGLGQHFNHGIGIWGVDRKTNRCSGQLRLNSWSVPIALTEGLSQVSQFWALSLDRAFAAAAPSRARRVVGSKVARNSTGESKQRMGAKNGRCLKKQANPRTWTPLLLKYEDFEKLLVAMHANPEKVHQRSRANLDLTLL